MPWSSSSSSSAAAAATSTSGLAAERVEVLQLAWAEMPEVRVEKTVFRPELWLSFFQNGVYPFVIKHGELEDGSMRKSSTNGGLRIAMFDYQSV